MTGHPEAAAVFLRDAAHARRHDQAVWWVRQQRDAAARAVPDWEALRERAEGIKAHTASRLADYLEEFAGRAAALGAHVHWPRSRGAQPYRARAPRRAPRDAAGQVEVDAHRGVRLNPYLEARGIEVIDTDLGERIVQLSGQAPSHIVMPPFT